MEVKAAPKPAPQPPNVERLGTVWALKAGYGFIKPADGGPTVFFHFAACRGFTPAFGMTVQYVPVADPRGPKAVDVRLA